MRMRSAMNAFSHTAISLAQSLNEKLAVWMALWRRVEGPEQEPPVWHCHYLPHRVSRDALTSLGSRLRGSIVDVGAGAGYGERFLDERSTVYFPTDLPSGRDAQDAAISCRGRAPVCHCSIYELPFANDRFGGGIALMVTEHLECPARGLAELFRVVKPGGLVLVSTPFAFPVHGAPADFRRWTRAGLESELRGVGFEVAETAACGAAFSTIAMNAILALRFHLLGSAPLPVRKTIGFALPLLLAFQALANVTAPMLDHLDRSGALPICVVALARKPASGPGQCPT
jgi:SAM-dependent methyltransferase